MAIVWWNTAMTVDSTCVGWIDDVDERIAHLDAENLARHLHCVEDQR